jgi:hypothetical protein
MSDEQTLLAVIAAIYLADCLYWIPRNGLGFARWLGKFWRLHSPSTIAGNDRGALGFANPQPPLGLASRGVGWTFSISERGIFSYTGASFNPGGRIERKAVFWEWSRIEKVGRDEKRILINGQYFAKAASEYSARWMAQEIGRLSKLNEKKRAVEIEALISRTCDPAEVSRRIDFFLKESRLLRYLANWLFVFLFGACPYLVWKLGMVRAIWPMAIGIYAQTIVIALFFSKLHRKIYPADSGQVFKPFLTMLLAAPSAIRAQDILGRPLLETFHPLAAAKALCSTAEFERFAGVVVRDLQYPRMPVVPPDSLELARQTESEFRELLLRSLRDQLSLDEKKFLAPPEKSEGAHTQYCPRCWQQFTEGGEVCPDCGSRPLVKF